MKLEIGHDGTLGLVLSLHLREVTGLHPAGMVTYEGGTLLDSPRELDAGDVCCHKAGSHVAEDAHLLVPGELTKQFLHLDRVDCMSLREVDIDSERVVALGLLISFDFKKVNVPVSRQLELMNVIAFTIVLDEYCVELSFSQDGSLSLLELLSNRVYFSFLDAEVDI